jgi:hypothetical protein
MLLAVEEAYPDKAIVAANLGTALELSGDNEEALRWIRVGVDRDPKEHYGTEWLHVMILEAKIALAKDPGWLAEHSVLGLDFGTQPRPLMPASMPLDESGKPRTANANFSAITYQLMERAKFVGRRDAIVADLHETQGNLSYAVGYAWSSTTGRQGNPRSSYEAAQRSGIDDASLVLSRLSQFEKDFPGRSWWENPTVTKP